MVICLINMVKIKQVLCTVMYFWPQLTSKGLVWPQETLSSVYNICLFVSKSKHPKRLSFDLSAMHGLSFEATRLKLRK